MSAPMRAARRIRAVASSSSRRVSSSDPIPPAGRFETLASVACRRMKPRPTLAEPTSGRRVTRPGAIGKATTAIARHDLADLVLSQPDLRKSDRRASGRAITTITEIQDLLLHGWPRSGAPPAPFGGRPRVILVQQRPRLRVDQLPQSCPEQTPDE